MIFKVRVNNEAVFNLCEWNNSSYAENPVLKIQTDDFNAVKNTFTNINLVELFQDSIKICEYTAYDTYASITYLGMVFVSYSKRYEPCIAVQLKKTYLADQVRRLEEAISNNVDVNSMSVDEYRDFVLEQVSKDCTQDIYNGTTIMINGTEQNFSFKSEDQINLLQLYLMTKMYPTITAVPYHADGNTCMFYTAEQIQTIYMTLIIRLITITTYVNQLNLYAKTMMTKNDLSQIKYGMELPEEYSSVVSRIVSEMVAALNGITEEEGGSNEQNTTVGD